MQWRWWCCHVRASEGVQSQSPDRDHSILVLISQLFILPGMRSPNWFARFPKNTYRNLNTANYLETAISDDAAAILWLNDNIKEGQPIILETNSTVTVTRIM